MGSDVQTDGSRDGSRQVVGSETNIKPACAGIGNVFEFLPDSVIHIFQPSTSWRHLPRTVRKATTPDGGGTPTNPDADGYEKPAHLTACHLCTYVLGCKRAKRPADRSGKYCRTDTVGGRHVLR